MCVNYSPMWSRYWTKSAVLKGSSFIPVYALWSRTFLDDAVYVCIVSGFFIKCTFVLNVRLN